MLKLRNLVLSALCATAAVLPAHAEDAFKPEQLSVKETIDPGPNVFVYEQEWKGAGSIAVYDQTTLKLKGLLPSGLMGQMLISPDGKTAYAQSTFMKRIVYGDKVQAIQKYDVPTMKVTGDYEIPPKAAMVAGYTSLMRFSADGKLLYIQNATPASSVTVLDLASGATLQEIPTPGCWGIYPTLQGHMFSSLCGDGAMTAYTLSDDGKTATSAPSKPIFDPDADALFIEDERLGDDLYFDTATAEIYKLADKGATPELVEKIAMTKGVDGAWAPGGYQIMGVNAANGVLFVGMHSKAKEGSHKNGSEEIWAYDLKAKKILSRSKAEGITAVTVTPGKTPVVFGTTEEGKLLRFTSDPAKGYALTAGGEASATGFVTSLQVVE